MAKPQPPLLSTKKLRVDFDGRCVLHDINLSIHQGEVIAIVGPNGGGKTSLLKAILGLVPIKEGHVTKIKGLRFGYMPQKLKLDKVLPLTVQRFIRMGGQNWQHSIESCHLSPLLSRSIHELSGGELQKVLFARALACQPQLLVLDEPTQGIDVEGQAQFYQLLTSIIKDQHCGVIMVSHDIHVVMASTAHVYCINGHICCHGQPDAIAQHPEFISLFGGKAPFAIYTHHHDHHHDDFPAPGGVSL